MALAQRLDLLQAASDGKDLSVFRELTKDGDIDCCKDEDGNTFLSLAARNGHEDFVNLLLARGAKISTRNSDDKTPLAYAAENGHQKIVELLLNSQNRSGHELDKETISAAVWSAAAGGRESLLGYLIREYSPDLERYEIQETFHRAVAGGHTEMVKLWLAKYNVDTNETDNSGNTALYRATEACHKDVVAVLLERKDIDINAQTGGGSAITVALASGYEDLADMLYARARTDEWRRCTVLHHAISNDDTKTVKWLLTKDGVDVNAKDRDNFTPLHTASRYGRTETANLLLTRSDIIINAENDKKETPLHLAAENGHTEIIILLLARNDIVVNAATGFRSTPLHLAAENGHTEIVKLLLAKNEIMVNERNNNYATALDKATENNHTEIIKLLLARNDIMVNAATGVYVTPLLIAAKNGYTEIVKFLLARNDIMVNTIPHNNKTPLHMATENGHTEIVKLLLARNDIMVNATANENITPLHMAVENGHTEILKLLLASKEVNVNAQASRRNIAPLHIAAFEGNTELVRLLLENDGINVNAIADDDKTPISLALQERQKDVIALLLRKDDLDLNSHVFRSGDLIHWATEAGQREIMDLVLARESNAYPNRTLLTRYSENGYIKALERLLKRDGIDVNSKDSGGRSPLSRAAEKGHGIVVEMLLQYGADGNFKDSDGRTPLWQAAKNEHEEIVKQLAPDDTTALFHLMTERNNRAIDLILRYKPNLEQKNDRGQTALHLAVLLGYQDIARALMLKGVNVNSKDDYDMTPLQLAMQKRNEDLIQELLARGASPEGIMGKEWRDAFGKHNEDMVRLSKGPGGDYYVDFPTETLTGQEILQTSDKTKSHLYLLSNDPNKSNRLNIPSTIFSRKLLEPNKLQIATQKLDGNILDVSISLRLSINKLLYEQPLGAIDDNKVSQIMWRSMQSENPSSPWTTVIYFSTLPYGWIPEDGVDIFRQFLIYIKTQWLELCHKFDDHLAKRRLDQMEFKGKNPQMIDFLAKDAQKLAGLRAIIVGQTSEAETFIRDYCLHYNANQIPQNLLGLLKHDVETDITNRIGNLEQTVRDLLTIEFAWITIHETRVSTKLGQNVMLLTYVSIFYLPLGFCATLWAIPNITDTSTRTPFILTAIVVSLITLIVTFNMESIFRFIQQGHNAYTAFRTAKRRPQSPRLP